MKKLVAVIISLVVVMVMSAQEMPASLSMLSSKAALRAFAAENARSVDLTISSDGMEGSWGTGTSWEEPLTTGVILDRVNELKFTFHMINPEDYVQAEARIKNAQWEDLFVAWSWRQPETTKTQGVYQLPELYFSFRLADYIPIKVDRSVVEGYIKYLNDDGRTIGTVYLNIRNGKINFPSSFAGRGILTLRNNEGERFLYDLRNDGVAVPVSKVSMTKTWSWIEDMPSFRDTSVINYQVWTWDGYGNNPTFEVVMTNRGTNQVRTYSNEGAEAVGFHVRQQGVQNWTYYPVVAPAKYAVIPMAVGTHYMVPEWKSGDMREYPIYWGEKGGGVPVYSGGLGRAESSASDGSEAVTTPVVAEEK